MSTSTVVRPRRVGVVPPVLGERPRRVPSRRRLPKARVDIGAGVAEQLNRQPSCGAVGDIERQRFVRYLRAVGPLEQDVKGLIGLQNPSVGEAEFLGVGDVSQSDVLGDSRGSSYRVAIERGVSDAGGRSEVPLQGARKTINSPGYTLKRREPGSEEPQMIQVSGCRFYVRFSGQSSSERLRDSSK
jgi:hypothetical protein